MQNLHQEIEKQTIFPFYTLYFQEIISLQINNPDFFSLKIKRPDFIARFQECLENIPTDELLELCRNNPAFQRLIVQVFFLFREDLLYRKSDERISVATWSDKLMSLIGTLDKRTILTGQNNLDGKPVRNKRDAHNKSAESAEVLAIHTAYLEASLNYITKETPFDEEHLISEVMAEVADVVYNLTQLVFLEKDQKYIDLYEKYLKQIQEIFLVNQSDMLNLVIAKYHYRMYASENGRNAYDDENKFVLKVIKKQFPHLIGDLLKSREIIDTSFKFLDKTFAKLQNILYKKFLPHYSELGSKHQEIIVASIEDMIKMMIIASEDPNLAVIVNQLLNEFGFLNKE